MVDKNLAQMGDRELIKLFTITSDHGIPHRAKQARAELERRGYIFDPTHQDFVKCEDWNTRYPEAHRDCEKEARWRGDDERRLDGR